MAIVRRLGRVDYEPTFRRMREFTHARDERTPDELWLLEHPPVFTQGQAGKPEHVLAAGDIPVVQSDRGGQVTYHGPGQLVAYPILLLEDGEKDLHAFLRNMEQAVIATCEGVGVVADREPGKTGVWMTDEGGARKKLCSMGIACRKWVTFHGLALNVTTDLSYFRRINPCGFEANVMTSLAAQREVDPARVKATLIEQLGVALNRSVRLAA